MQLIKSKAETKIAKPIIYEVNLTIDNDIIDEFDAWLQKHIDEMLAIPGFISAATLVIENNDEDTKQRSVQYRLVDQESLDTYFEKDAERMRAEGLAKFPNKMTAQRRILTPSQAALAEEAACANCGTQLEGRFCSSCGQREEPRVPTFTALIKELTNATFGLESKLWRSIYILIFRPGKLTVEYLSGKRQKFTSPLRLYLLFSILTIAYITINGDQLTENFQAVDGAEVRFDLTEDDLNNIPEGVLPTGMEGSLKKKVLSLGETLGADIENKNYSKILIKFLEPLPTALLIFLPFIAVIFKLVYLGSGKYYVEHVIYLLHNHAVLFSALFFSLFTTILVSKNFSQDYCLGIGLFILMTLLFFYKRIQQYIVTFKQKWFRISIKILVWSVLVYGLFQLVVQNGLNGFLILLWIFCIPYYLYRSMRVVYSRGRLMTVINYAVISLAYLVLWVVTLLLMVIFTGYNYG